MRRNFFRLAVGAFLALQTVAVSAQDGKAPPVFTRNAGALTCDNLSQTFQGQGDPMNKTAMLQWLAGYSTAAARMNRVVDTFPISDTLELLRMVVLVCNEMPDVQIETGILQTLSRLQPFWVRQDTSTLTLNDANNNAVYYTEAVRPLQQALANLGYDVTVDGKYGNQTGNAIAKLLQQYQQPASLVPTGVLMYILTRPQQ